jgi:hypothetical protein
MTRTAQEIKSRNSGKMKHGARLLGKTYRTHIVCAFKKRKNPQKPFVYAGEMGTGGEGGIRTPDSF